MSFINIRTHPLRFLLYLEWAMFAIALIAEILRFLFFPIPRNLSLNLLSFLLFALMGLALPAGRKLHKIVYTGLEFWFVQLASIAGGMRLFSLLYIVLVTRNCLIFERWQRWAIAGFAYICFLLTQIERLQHRILTAPRPIRGMPPPDRIPLQPPRFFAHPERFIFTWLTSVLLFGLVLVFLQLFVSAILAERKSRERLAAANAQLRNYALRIEDVATLQERNRIAREIHDSLGHSLTAFNLHLDAALRLLASDPVEAKALLVEAKKLGSKSLQEIRQSVATLRSDPLQGKSLPAAIASLLDDFQRSTGISPQSQIELNSPLPKELKTATYRIVQEALTNICKYAEATQASVQIKTTTKLHLTIQDNGNGFNLAQNSTGFGLQGMQERTKALGGQFQVLTAPANGCKIIATFPIPRL